MEKSIFFLLKVAIVGGTLAFASPKQNFGGRIPDASGDYIVDVVEAPCCRTG